MPPYFTTPSRRSLYRLRRLPADIGHPLVTEDAGLPLMQKPPCLSAILAQPRVVSTGPESKVLPVQKTN